MSRSRPSPPVTEEEALALRRCLAGQVEAFEPLVRLHAPRIIRLAYHFLGDWDEARDVSQETFSRAYLCLERYDAARSFSAWLSTIAARLATDRLRRRRLIRRVPAPAPPPPAVDAETALSLKEALDLLTPRQREAVVLCDLHGFTAVETARTIGCSAATVRVLRFLARRRMREVLQVPGRGAAEEGLAVEGAE